MRSTDEILTAPTNPVSTFVDQLIRIKRPPVDPILEAEAISLQIETPGEWPDGDLVEVRVHKLGSGPNALLVHGWQGRRSDLSAMCERIVAAGFTVWLPDLPGHGESGGERLSIPLAAAVLQAVEQVSGPIAVALGHSIGGACIVQALQQGLAAKKIVFLATPTHYGNFVRTVANKAGLQQDEGAILSLLERLIGVHPDRIDMLRQAQNLQQPARFFHSSDDPVVSFSNAKRVASAWRGAEFQALEGLGHYQLLKDVQVLGKRPV